MSSSEAYGTDRALAREWLIARIVVIGGFIVAIVAAIYFGYLVPRVLAPRQVRAALHSRIELLLKTEAQICTTALNDAKNFGIVPQYGHLANAKLGATDVQGRYVCVASTPAAKYLLAIDLICRDLKNPRCTSLYNIVQGNGAVLYQRQS
ncbi:MAG TPA: hypothetical protein VGF97_00835 [Rhizomicrobium sp.]|jgi:hypothetical protein